MWADSTEAAETISRTRSLGQSGRKPRPFEVKHQMVGRRDLYYLLLLLEVELRPSAEMELR